MYIKLKEINYIVEVDDSVEKGLNLSVHEVSTKEEFIAQQEKQVLEGAALRASFDKAMQREAAIDALVAKQVL